jgi:hypothetical protein
MSIVNMTNVTDFPLLGRVSSSAISQQHTLGHHDCPACESQKATLLRSISADLTLEEALDQYIALRSIDATPGAISARYVSEHTQRMDRNHKESLLLFFRGMRLCDIHWYNMRAYQKARVSGEEPFIRYRRPQDAKPKKTRSGEIVAPPKGKTPCPVKPQQVNQELGTLKSIKLFASCWTEEDDLYYQMLTPREEGIPRALSPEEQRIWIDVSRCRERWMVVHWWSIVAIDSCMSTNEVDGLRIGDLNLHQQIVTVPWPCAKNKYRKRTIAIENADALWAWDRLLARAYDLGAREPQHHLLPFGNRGGHSYNPTKHMTGSGIKRQWLEIREATKLDWVDRYGMRHTGATRLAENGVPIDIIMSRMGHATEEMRQHYTQISISAQRRWLRPQPYTQHMYAPPPAQMQMPPQGAMPMRPQDAWPQQMTPQPYYPPQSATYGSHGAPEYAQGHPFFQRERRA